MNKRYKYLFTNILAAPFDGFYEMRRRNRGNIWFVVLMYSLFALMQIANYTMSGFMVNKNNLQDFNLLKSVASGLFPFLLFAVANYSITTLGDGKGFLKDIVKVMGYALFPLLICHALALGLSWIVNGESVVFYYILIVLGYLVFAFYSYIGLIVIHEYNFRQSVLYLLLTVVAMAAIVFIAVLLLTLFQQLIGFVTSVWREFIMRG
jgi:hypothetical protein